MHNLTVLSNDRRWICVKFYAYLIIANNMAIETACQEKQQQQQNVQN